MEMNNRNITRAVAVAIVVIVGGYYLIGSGGEEATEAPAAASE